jgi:uncharacterized protein DUF3761
MKISTRLLTVAAALLAVNVALAQAPAGATGQCKDGTYTTAASKKGACRGHKGVQTWLAAESGPAPVTKSTAASTPAAAPAAISAASGPAPAGATGQCKDGTYTTAASKKGACRGHKGVQTWLAADTVPTAAPVAATRPAPVAAPAPMAPMNMPAKASTRPSTSSMQQATGGGPRMVWVNTSSKVYHCAGTKYYGKTKEGKYMSEADAKASGARPDHGNPCTK